MPPRRRIAPAEGHAAVQAWRSIRSSGGEVPRTVTATAVRYTLEELASRRPGRSVEVRVPPYGVVQCIEGGVHTRGTPPSVVETDASTWLALTVGECSWQAAVDSGAVVATGLRTDLSADVPLWPTSG